jgi:hypothetical protein
MAADYVVDLYRDVASSTGSSLALHSFLVSIALFGFFYRVRGAIIAPIFLPGESHESRT